MRVTNYAFCTSVGQQYAEINKECGVPDAGLCGFDKGDFCSSKIDAATTLTEECLSGSQCTETCRQAVETYVAQSGCCVAYLNSILESFMLNVADIFSACGVNIPNPCTQSIPPEEFLDCARQQSSSAEGIYPASVVIMISAIIGAIIGNFELYIIANPSKQHTFPSHLLHVRT